MGYKMKTLLLTIWITVLFLLFIPLATAAEPALYQSPVDDIARWFENAFEDVQLFFDNLGENLARAVENMLGSVSNFGKAIQEQFQGINRDLTP
jgi:hypothetical protein